MTYYPANLRYEKKNVMQVKVGFNRSTEPELVKRLEEEPNRARYIKNLVREDVERRERESKEEKE